MSQHLVPLALLRPWRTQATLPDDLQLGAPRSTELSLRRRHHVGVQELARIIMS
ncbi:hypothetical protein PUNSTDRAFT_52494 [Punctularia strigosozonata HHB-11173 SS5]|uniref:uncharacterized protein n=1 Tax=Punctularia strigosozonata (strain HHB-11173) TaxID=741275 RepID=UPI0004417A03|nr:uncharacterized protein PUNSTDRAFT_52494 [Punctularia strigosozonata HHB-11173 SS5]EIN09096.1 hypothetical protein PUNSTDRAFT_52494 [Punctularia strigosozonata HHB-11173 SS5]